jgi:photosystem II stability/assembly factor-like uncharacterized protein
VKRILLLTFGILITISIVLVISYKLNETNDKMVELRKQHEYFLKHSPFKETLKLSKSERKARGIAPNKYFERDWELTMNPRTGEPEPEKLFALQEQLQQRKLFAKVPGENLNNWVERGPNNVGGRTRAIMFDPNDATHKRVFAGGVSGGLWVNNDITSSTSSWTEVNIPQNLAISCITYDPNNPMIFYLGTGESYVQGRVNGNGVWKSSDGGDTWAKIFGGVTGTTAFVTNARVTVNSPGSIAGNYQVTLAAFGPTLTSVSGNLVLVNDATAAPNQGCSSLTNGTSINGKIAVVQRGGCNFTVKVKNAQDAGAIAVLVVNNVSGPPITLGGEDATITIPSVMISKSEGDMIMEQLGSGVNVTLTKLQSSVLANYVTPGIHHINDIKVRDLGGGNSEVYVAAASTIYRDATPISWFGIQDFGLYKSSNNGSSWSKIALPLVSRGSDYTPNDIEISADKTVWISTVSNPLGEGGGTVLSSSDGTNFNVKKTILNGDRTQIAVSATNANKLYVLAELANETNGVQIISTTDSFSTETNLPLPDDIDTDIPATDFTNGQAFYNLLLEVDPNNDAIVYVGGIDLFKSITSGSIWSQISEYYTSTGLSNVHPDHHAFVFHPTDSNRAVNGNDGGVYYGTSLSTSPSFSPRNRNYNTLQFYHGSIGQEVANAKFLAGSQDNGSQLINNAVAGLNSSSLITGGDGAFAFIAKDNAYMVSSSQNGNYYYRDYATGTASGYSIETGSLGGQFINPSALDSATDYLFGDGSTSGTYQINRYKLGTTSATLTTASNALLDAAPTAFKVSSVSPTPTLFIGTENGKLLKYSNYTSTFSQTWTELTGSEFFGSISCIELGATENEIYVTFYNYGVTSVYYSPDGGSSWQNKEGNLPDLPVRAIMKNPLNSNEVIIGTDLGVWATPNFNDANPSWYQSQNGMKDVVVTSFDLRTADNTVMATTYGRGMFTGTFTAAASALSVHKNTLNNLIDVYPTVSNGNFKIKAQNSVQNGYLKIFNMKGQEVYASKIDFNRNTVKNISLNVASGMYIVKFTSDTKQSTQKIVIK